MEEIKLDRNNFSPEEISRISRAFGQEKVIAYPTDTIYGIGCVCFSEKAAGRIYEIKKRDKAKTMLVLVSSLGMAKKYCRISGEQERYLKTVWPGPVTVVMASKGNLPKYISGKDSGVAMRLPNDKFLRKLIRKIGYPIISTSLNISGKKELNNIEMIGAYFKDKKPDLVVNAGMLRGNSPSKIIDIRDIRNIIIIRQ